MKKIAFNTANLVGRVSGYRFALSNWGKQHERTVAATDETEFAAICSEIAATGFRNIELWQAHADPSAITQSQATIWRTILQDHDLTPIAYAGNAGTGAFEVCGWLGIPCIVGGTAGSSMQTISEICAATGIAFYYENHPEKSVEELRAKVAGADPVWIGLGVDLGWLGTQGVDAPAALRELGPLVRHVHVKDVQAPGGHETVPLGAGCVRPDACVDTLRAAGYAGWYSWEDEPEGRNPFEIAATCRQWLESRLSPRSPHA